MAPVQLNFPQSAISAAFAAVRTGPSETHGVVPSDILTRASDTDQFGYQQCFSPTYYEHLRQAALESDSEAEGASEGRDIRIRGR